MLSILKSADDLVRDGIAASGRGEYRAAVEAFTRALKKSPRSMPALANRATAYSALGEHDSALADLNAAIALVPVMPALYFNRGGVHRDRGDIARALADYSQAIAMDAEMVAAYYNRALLLAAENADAALDDLARVLELKPDYYPVYAERARIYEAMGRTDEARQDRDAYAAQERAAAEKRGVGPTAP
jgi:tetratricopeptide (TPR) repeat protein